MSPLPHERQFMLFFPMSTFQFASFSSSTSVYIWLKALFAFSRSRLNLMRARSMFVMEESVQAFSSLKSLSMTLLLISRLRLWRSMSDLILVILWSQARYMSSMALERIAISVLTQVSTCDFISTLGSMSNNSYLSTLISVILSNSD